MDKEKRHLLENRIMQVMSALYGESDSEKTQRDTEFCRHFFEAGSFDGKEVHALLTQAIAEQNEEDLDFSLFLITHFGVEKSFALLLAPLMLVPWHHLHDSIASTLEFHPDPALTDFWFQAAAYRCDNLDYESDYCEFNRKCLFALKAIGTNEAIFCIKKITECENEIIANNAKEFIKMFL